MYAAPSRKDTDLLDHYAAAAMQAIMSRSADQAPIEIAKLAVVQAEAMVQARNAHLRRSTI